MNLPEIIYWLDEFDFNVALDVGEIPAADNAANYIPPMMIRKDHRLARGQRIRHPKHAAIVEHNDGPAFFTHRAVGPCTIGFLAGQTSDSDGHFEANWIGSRRLPVRVFSVLGSRSRLGHAGQFGGVFDRERHGTPIMVRRTPIGTHAPPEYLNFRL